MRKNEPTLAIGGVDTAEKEPPKDTGIPGYRAPPAWIKSTESREELADTRRAATNGNLIAAPCRTLAADQSC